MPWIPVWFEEQQWYDLAARFPEILAVARLEQPEVKAEMGLPEVYSFNAFYEPYAPYGKESQTEPTEESYDELRNLFVTASKNVIQRNIGTALFFLERVRAGDEVLLRARDGTVSKVTMSAAEGGSDFPTQVSTSAPEPQPRPTPQSQPPMPA